VADHTLDVYGSRYRQFIFTRPLDHTGRASPDEVRWILMMEQNATLGLDRLVRAEQALRQIARLTIDEINGAAAITVARDYIAWKRAMEAEDALKPLPAQAPPFKELQAPPEPWYYATRIAPERD
jgi:thioredoxin-like negative regulator of GroEL